jgi:hypothetical protein
LAIGFITMKEVKIRFCLHFATFIENTFI